MKTRMWLTPGVVCQPPGVQGGSGGAGLGNGLCKVQQWVGGGKILVTQFWLSGSSVALILPYPLFFSSANWREGNEWEMKYEISDLRFLSKIYEYKTNYSIDPDSFHFFLYGMPPSSLSYYCHWYHSSQYRSYLQESFKTSHLKVHYRSKNPHILTPRPKSASSFSCEGLSFLLLLGINNIDS